MSFWVFINTLMISNLEHHCRDVMSQLANALEGQDGEGAGRVPYVRVDGDTDSRDRRSAVLKFREDPSVKVALLSITAAGLSPPCITQICMTVHLLTSCKPNPRYSKGCIRKPSVPSLLLQSTLSKWYRH